LRLFGYALVVIINYINKDTKEKVEQKLESTRFIYQPKASKYERNKGLEGFEEKKSRKWVGGMELTGSGNKRIEIDRNIHPTVKPIKLMQYLVRLVTPPNGIVLDPFCGSGTTGIACKLEGFEFVGLEQDAEYCKIAQVRIDNYVEEKEKSKKSIKPKEDNNFKQPTLF
jgi:site-specific DNA-methyltransferase (adenine-specific)